MNKLLTLYKNLATPNTDNKDFFSSCNIDGFEGHKLGKDFLSRPSLLIKIPENYESHRFGGLNPKFPFKLDNLEIRQNVDCVINDDIGNKENFALLTFTGEDELQNSFFDISETILSELGQHPTSKKIHEVILKFIDLFKGLQKLPKREIQGLCGELMIMLHSNHTKNLISAWHTNNYETYDFSFNEKQIEVKSSNNEKRIHHFSHRQLLEVKDSEVYIASVIMNESSGGISIEQLISKILDKVNQDPLVQSKLFDICSKTLRDKNFIENYQDYLFNFEIANQSVQYLNYDQIPTLENPNEGVITDIEFNCNLAYFSDKKLSDEEVDALHSSFN